MGIDLKILPSYGKADMSLSLNVLTFHRDLELFDLLLKLDNKHGVDCAREGFKSYVGSRLGTEGSCFDRTEWNSFGQRIRSVLARDIIEVVNNYKSLSYQNKAILAYLKELPHD